MPCSLLDSGFAPLARPGMTEESNVKQPRKIARILCGAGYAVVPFPSLVKYEGMARREDASGSSIAHLPFGKMRRPSARHRGVLSATGRASGNRLRGVRPLSEHDPFRAAVPSSLERAVRPAISQLLAGGHSASERSPVTARELGGAFTPRPRAPRPAPPSRRLMTAPSSSRTGRIIVNVGIRSRGDETIFWCPVARVSP
jgi:hypothetical protein